MRHGPGQGRRRAWKHTSHHEDWRRICSPERPRIPAFEAASRFCDPVPEPVYFAGHTHMADTNLSSFIWSVADLLRGDYKQSEYGKVILPFTVLRRLDCVLEPTKAAVLAETGQAEEGRAEPRAVPAPQVRPALLQHVAAGHEEADGRPGPHQGEPVRLHAGVLARRARHLRELRLPHPDRPPAPRPGCSIWSPRSSPTSTCTPNVVSNAQMGAVFEELIRKFAELSNETAGEHFTPREVIRLMVNLIFIEDDEALTKPGVVRSHLRSHGRHRRHAVASPASIWPSMNPDARLVMYGQELNPESYAICKADMLIKGQDIANIIFGNTLSDDGLPGQALRLHALQSAVRRGVEEDREGGPQGGRAAGLQRALRPRPAARQRRLAAVPAAPDLQDAARRSMAAAASASSSTARRCSPAARARARARSAATCWRTTWSRPSSACPPTCSTTPASAPMSGSSATASRPPARARCN